MAFQASSLGFMKAIIQIKIRWLVSYWALLQEKSGQKNPDYGKPEKQLRLWKLMVNIM